MTSPIRAIPDVPLPPTTAIPPPPTCSLLPISSSSTPSHHHERRKRPAHSRPRRRITSLSAPLHPLNADAAQAPWTHTGAAYPRRWSRHGASGSPFLAFFFAERVIRVRARPSQAAARIFVSRPPRLFAFKARRLETAATLRDGDRKGRTHRTAAIGD